MGESNSTSVEQAIRHSYAQIGGVRLHYAVRGAGDRLVLLLHGFPECWYSWRRQLESLSAERYTIVAPDLRGYNLSDKPPRIDDYALPRLVDDVTGLIRHFGKVESAIIGHDWGAAIAWATALNYPEYVWKLVAMQVPPAAAWRANLTLGQMLRSWYMFFFQLPVLPEWLISMNDFALLERTFKNTVGRRGVFTDADVNVYKSALRQNGALTAAVNYYRANVLKLLWPSCGDDASDQTTFRPSATRKVRSPTLFIYGEHDIAIIPDTVRGVGAYVDGPYRELRIADSGHWVQNEAPGEVNIALQEFLDAD